MKTACVIFCTSVFVLINTLRVNAQQSWTVIDDFSGEGLKKGGVSTIPTLEDVDGNIWLTTNSGSIYKYVNKEPLTTIDLGCSTPLKQKKLHNEDCFKLFIDSRKELWLTSKNKGIAKYNGTEWKNLSNDINLESKHITCSLEDSKGNIWFGTNKGLVEYNGNEWLSNKADGLSDVEIRQIIEAATGKIWIDTKDEFVYVAQNDDWKQIALGKLGFEKGDYRTMFPSSNGDVWIVSQSIVGYFRNGEWVSLGNTFDGVEVEEINKVIKSTFYNLDKRLLITEDVNHNIWIGHKSGVYLYTGKDWRSFDKEEGVPDKWQIHSFVTDGLGNLYTGGFKNDGKLYKFSKDGLQKIDLKGEKFLVSIFVEDSGTVWVSGAKGIFKIGKGETEGELVKKTDFGYMYHDAYKDSKGNIWFGLQGFKSKVVKLSAEN